MSCSEKTREEITERYESGSKKLLLVYKGEGKNEKVSQRVDYWENGITKLKSHSDYKYVIKDMSLLFKNIEN